MKKATQTIIAVVVLVILFEAAAVVLALNVHDDYASYGSGQSQLVLARSVARQIETHVSSNYDALTMMSNVPEIRDGSADECNSKLLDLFGKLKITTSAISRTNKEYVRYCSTLQQAIGTSVKGYAYAQTIFNDPLHKPVMGRALQSAVYSDRYFVAISVPVFDKNGGFAGTLGSMLYLDDLQKKYFGEGLKENLKAMVIDDDGTVLYAPSKQLIGKNMRSDSVKNFIGDGPKFDRLLDNIDSGGAGVATITAAVDNAKYSYAYVPANVFEGRRWAVIVLALTDGDAIGASDKENKFLGMHAAVYILALLFDILFVLATVTYLYLRRK